MLALLLLAPFAAPACPPQQLLAARFTPGEVLSYRLDALGADVGTFEVRVEPPPRSEKRAALQLSSRAKTSAFIATNVGRYEAFAVTLLAPDLSPLHYREDVDEGAVHKAVELDFPPQEGALKVQASKNGEPEPFALPAGSGVRDMISTLFVLRAQPLREGAPFCVEVYAGRKLWRVTGKVAARETIETPLGRLASVRLDAEAVSADGRLRRDAHFWIGDDARRLPLVAVGEVRGKALRAQLVHAGGGRFLAGRAGAH